MPTSASTSSARASPASTPCTGRRSCCLRASRPRPASTSTRTSPSAAPSCPSPPAPVPPRPELTKRYGQDAPALVDHQRCQRRPATPTSPSTASSRKANETLANGLGNAVNRVTTLRHRYQNPAGSTLQSRSTGTATGLQADVATALANFDRRGATDLITRALAELNQRIEADRPWKLAGHPDTIQQLTELLDGYVETLATSLAPLTPSREHSPGSPSINSTPIPRTHPTWCSHASTPPTRFAVSGSSRCSRWAPWGG